MLFGGAQGVFGVVAGGWQAGGLQVFVSSGGSGMSSSLCWEPVFEQANKTFGCSLKFFLREEFSIEQDGGCEFGPEDVAFLLGAKACAAGDLKKDLAAMIEAIQKHGRIRLWERY